MNCFSFVQGFLQASPYKVSEKKDFLRRLAFFQRTLLQGVPVVTNFLIQYLPFWDDRVYFAEVSFFSYTYSYMLELKSKDILFRRYTRRKQVARANLQALIGTCLSKQSVLNLYTFAEPAPISTNLCR